MLLGNRNYLSVWHMNDPVKDEVGTLESKDTGTISCSGIIGKSRHFGGGKGINCGEKITTYPFGSSPHSSEAWFRAEKPNATVLAWGNEERDGKVMMQFFSPPHIKMECYFSGADVAGGSALPMSQWIHVIHTYKNGDSRVYVNGRLDGVSTSTGHPLAIKSPARMYIGGWYNNYGFIGDIDEVRISKVTRSADRVRLEYENQKPLQTLAGMLVQPGADFFDLCDEYGLLVWDEFGANHEHAVTHPDIVVENARDRVRRFRNHASVVLWCGANEHGPHGAMEPGMKEAVEKFDGTRYFLPNSTLQPPMEGDGPYTYCGPGYYFGLAKGMRAEVGLKAVPVVKSIRRMMPRRHLWPITQAGWGAHEWVNAGNNAGWCGDTETAISRYGAPHGVEDFCRKAQMVNMESAKSMFEGWNDKMWNDCTGMLIWMSNPVWPCLTFNIYDYYLEPTAGYFGCKKACEPVHIQWNISSGQVKAINNTLQALNGLTAEARIYHMDGREYSKKSVPVDCPANSVTKCFDLAEADSEKSRSKDDLSKVYFIKLELKDRDGRLLSDNFYWQSRASAEYERLSEMPRLAVTGTVNQTRDKDFCRVTVDVRNGNQGVALMTRLKLVDVSSGLLVAPVLYSDNYFSLLRGEEKQVTLEFKAKNVSGDEVAVQVEGWNVNPAELARIK